MTPSSPMLGYARASVEHLGIWQTADTCDAQVISNWTSSFLRPGSKFKGTQQSDRQNYNVEVEIKYVDMAESFLCGYLRIEGKSRWNAREVCLADRIILSRTD